jgi:tetratricopeptide (TPR) repeat protein
VADSRLETALERHKKGDVEFAYKAYRQVLEAYPEHPTALHYLGLVAQQTGHSAEAANLLQRSIAGNPRDPRAHNHLGQVMIALNRRDVAIACFEKALVVDPGHVDSLNSLANVVKAADLSRAISLYRRVLELDPRATHATYNLANALRDDHAYEEALQLYARAVEIDPRHLHAHHNLGVLLEQKGRFEEAIGHYEAVLRIEPRHVTSLSNLMGIRSYQPDPRTVQDAEACLAAFETPDDDRIKLHRGLGKYYDGAGRFDDAFPHFARANALVRKRAGDFEVGAVREYVDRMIDAFPCGRPVKPLRSASGSSRPVFIIGMPRSGTTLTEQILASHPLIFGAGELQEIPRIAKSLRPRYPAEVHSLGTQALEELAQQYLNQLEMLAPARALRVTDKLPVNFMHLGLIATLFPDARIIHCRRDPMDVGLSCFIELFRMDRDFTTDLGAFGQCFLEHERLMAHWRSVLPVSIYELRYEDLVAEPETQSRALIARCGLEWDAACLEFQKTDRAVLTPSRWQVRQPIYASSVGRWRNYAAHMQPLKSLLDSQGYVYERKIPC